MTSAKIYTPPSKTFYLRELSQNLASGRRWQLMLLKMPPPHAAARRLRRRRDPKARNSSIFPCATQRRGAACGGARFIVY